MRTATFILKRNDAIDMIRALKQMVKRYDDPCEAVEYVALHLIKSKDLIIDIKIKKDSTCN